MKSIRNKIFKKIGNYNIHIRKKIYEHIDDIVLNKIQSEVYWKVQNQINYSIYIEIENQIKNEFNKT